MRSPIGRFGLLVLIVLLTLGMFSVSSFISLPAARADSIVATITLSQPPSGVAVNPVTNMIYTVNGHGIIDVINGSTDTVTDSLTVTNGTFSIAVNPETNLVYVGNSFYDMVTVINGTNNKVVATIQNVDGDQVTVDPNTNTVFTLGSIINGATNTLIARITTSCGDAGATTIGVDTATDMAYVTAAYSVGAPTPTQFCLSEINGETGAVVNVLNYNQETVPGPLAIDSNTNVVYEGYEGPTGNTVYTINGMTDTQTGSFTALNDSTPSAFDAQRNLLYVSGSSGIDIIDANTNTLIQTLDAPQCSGVIAINPTTDRIYVTDYNSDAVCVIQGSFQGSTGTSTSSSLTSTSSSLTTTSSSLSNSSSTSYNTSSSQSTTSTTSTTSSTTSFEIQTTTSNSSQSYQSSITTTSNATDSSQTTTQTSSPTTITSITTSSSSTVSSSIALQPAYMVVIIAVILVLVLSGFGMFHRRMDSRRRNGTTH